MRLSTVFELLLIFLFLALASSRHIDKKILKKGVTKQTNLNPYCKCTEIQCNCCRDFPVVPIKGPGCATLGYQTGDTLRLTMSFGDRILRNITLAGKRPKPVCMGLPGGISKFCGRLYNIQRVEDQFKACLSLELRALDELEAALRVSCFNFGPKGVKLEPGEPLPSVSRPADEDDDDDDYDIDDDDDDDDEFEDDDDEYNDVDTDGDYTGFAALSDQLFEGFFFPTSESNSNKKKKPARPVTQESFVDLELTTKATAVILNDTKEVSTTEAPQTTSAVSSSTQRILETTKGPTVVVSSTSPSLQKVTVSETTEREVSTEEVTDTTATESLISKEEKDKNETEDSASEEVAESENDEKEIETVEATERDEEDSDEGSAEEELDEAENEEASQAKLENDDEDDDDEDDDDEDSEEDHESAEHEEEKDEDNILNVFFNHDDDSTEKERERTRMEREKFKKILPGLMALLQPSPTPPTDDLSASFAYPAVRSARVHRRMRLPPI